MIVFDYFFRMILSMSLVILIFYFINILWGNRYSPRLQYMLWITIFIALLVPVRPQIKIPSFQKQDISSVYTQTNPQNSPEIGTVNATENNNEIPIASQEVYSAMPETNNENSIFIAMISIWAFIACFIFLAHVFKYHRFISMVKRWSADATDHDILEIYENAARDLGLKKSPQLKFFKFINSPMLIGFINPVILLPVVTIPKDELKLILYHELVHYKYKDLWFKLLTIVVRTLHWFNPFVYLAFHATQSACEMACDEKVMQQTNNTQKKNYIEAILGMISKKNQLNVSLSTHFYGGKKDMKKRFLSILENNKKIYLPALVSGCIIATGILASNIVFVEAKTSTTNTTATTTDIGAQKATEIALKHAGGGQVTKCQLDYEDGILVYEIEIINNTTAHDIQINASNGQILDTEYETLKNTIYAPSSTGNATTNEISIDKAKEIALKKTNGGTVIKWEQDYENGVKVYEIEVINGNNKYDMDIGAVDAKIYNYKQQTINKTGDNTYLSNLTVTGNEITEAKAKEIALAKSGGGTILNCYLDYENGRKVYEIRILNNNVKYEMDIATADGTIYDYEEKIIVTKNTNNAPTPVVTPSPTPTNTKTVPTPAATPNPTTANTITAERAKEIALNKAGGGYVVKCELDYENGVLVYEIEIKDGRWEYDIDVNATSGAIAQFDKDYDD